MIYIYCFLLFEYIVGMSGIGVPTKIVTSLNIMRVSLQVSLTIAPGLIKLRIVGRLMLVYTVLYTVGHVLAVGDDFV